MSAKQVLSRRNPWTQWTWTAGCIYPSSLYAASFWVIIYSLQAMQLLIYKPDKQDPCLKEHTIKQQNIWCN